MSVLRTRIAWTCVVLLGLTGCSPSQTMGPAKTIVAFPGTPRSECAQEEILPKITEIRPTAITPGSEVTVMASGGYFRDTCGGYDESARTYHIYVDDEPIADLSCSVNHCEGKFVLPDDTPVGSHCMGVQKGSCQQELMVVDR